jgi:hypothetical protein
MRGILLNRSKRRQRRLGAAEIGAENTARERHDRRVATRAGGAHPVGRICEMVEAFPEFQSLIAVIGTTAPRGSWDDHKPAARGDPMAKLPGFRRARPSIGRAGEDEHWHVSLH